MRRVQLTDDPTPGPGRSLILEDDEVRAVLALGSSWVMAAGIIRRRSHRIGLSERLTKQGLIETNPHLGWRLTSHGQAVRAKLTSSS